ncbi:MAG: hypothetical protein OEY19_12750 [Gammaproteobacteria bacterium]|nr:hypothetical protein [Gammaproteobacteria bacterium]
MSEAKSTIHDENAKTFLSILLNKDEKGIIQYMGKSDVFLTNGKINEDIMDFLYKSEQAWKSVNDIAAIDKLNFKIIPQESEVVTVIYYPEKFKNKIEDIQFLEKEWMEKYFACEFEEIDGKWTFYQNVCFAETGGPFHSY